MTIVLSRCTLIRESSLYRHLIANNKSFPIGIGSTGNPHLNVCLIVRLSCCCRFFYGILQATYVSFISIIFYFNSIYTNYLSIGICRRSKINLALIACIKIIKKQFAGHTDTKKNKSPHIGNLSCSRHLLMMNYSHHKQDFPQ